MKSQERIDYSREVVDGKQEGPTLSLSLIHIYKMNLTEEEKLEKKDQMVQNYAAKSERVHTVNQLLKAYTLFELDVEYVVIDNKVKIVDEQTGRIMEGRRYSDGLHQAIEAKENVKVEAATQTFATITLQNYFRMYHKLAGMTGTAETEAGEFWDIYKLDVVVIPTNKPVIRKDAKDVYKRQDLNEFTDFSPVIREYDHLILTTATEKFIRFLFGNTFHENLEHFTHILSLIHI